MRSFSLVLVVLLFGLSAFQTEAYTKEEYVEALKKLDFDAVKRDVKTLLTNSQEYWPADFGHYGGLLIRNAWHCAGSYRKFDGRGGCDGARLRFDPERSWPDNTNLDKANRLLWPIKAKYGLGLSWGDLIILAGNVAIEDMGGPVLGFCAGRVDDMDGEQSKPLGPTAEQEAYHACPVNGNCTAPLGASTVGLIYVNPGGPMGVPDPVASSVQIREVFSRMDMNDSETVALIGGGHAFGKCHGACPLGAGKSPQEDPSNSWPGLCGTGKGQDTFTSGFEGIWSETPTAWSNNYFTGLRHNKWEKHTGPGGNTQWRIVNTTSSPLMMLTTDIALLNDPTGEYQKLVNKFADDLNALDVAFSHAWYKLTTRDMGPVTRCSGPYVPPAQAFQNPLPAAPANLANFNEVKMAIRVALYSDKAETLMPDVVNGRSYYGGAFVHLAYQCASTFRSTDFQGGCNGARIRFAPERDWPINVGMDKALMLLKPIKDQFGQGLSWADLIVLSGTVALEEASATSIPFCGGRTDAADGTGSAFFTPNNDYAQSTKALRDKTMLNGLTAVEMVALSARPRSPAQLLRSGYPGSWTANHNTLSNDYFKVLLNERWELVNSTQAPKHYKAAGKNVVMLPNDLNLKWDAEYLSIAQDFATDNKRFLSTFASAWTKLMNIDRFSGPAGNVCATTPAPPTPSPTPAPTPRPSPYPSPYPSPSPSPSPRPSCPMMDAQSVINVNFEGMFQGFQGN